MKRGWIAVFVFVAVLCAVSASFSVGNLSNSITKKYAPASDIEGWINLSFSSESVNSVFEDSLGNEFSILEMLQKNTQASVNCTRKGCLPVYEEKTSNNELAIAIKSGEEKIFGIKPTGIISEIKSVQFDIESNSNVSCANQVKVDFLADGVYETGNKKNSDQVCEGAKSYGCFQPGNQTEEIVIGNEYYCQKMNISESPSVKIGAWVKKTEGGAKLTMYLYDGSKLVDYCTLPEPSSSGGEIDCSVKNLLLAEKEFYVCISSNQNGKYRTKGNINPAEKCGFSGLPVRTATSAFQIYAAEEKFAVPGAIEVENNMSNGTLAAKAQKYIVDNYGLNCDAKSCIIPIKIKSGANQNLIIKNMEIIYTKNSLQAVSDKILEIEETASEATSGFQKFNLDSLGLKLPSQEGNFSYWLNLNGQQVFSEKISIGGVATISSVSPTEVALGYETTFKAAVEKVGANITKYEWDFDGTKKTTIIGEVSYAFQTLGDHNLTLKITDKNGLTSTKQFIIKVQSPEAKINQTIISLEKSIADITGKIYEFSIFYQEILMNELGVNSSKTIVENAKRDFANASTSADYLKIISALNSAKIPDSILVTDKAVNFPFITDPDNINLDAVEEISSKSVESDADKYIDAIFLWNQDRLDNKISFEEISGIKNGAAAQKVTFFTIKINEKMEISDPYYLFLGQMDGVEFSKDYGQNISSGVYIIPVSAGSSVEFSTTEDIEFNEIPGFVSPGIESLSVSLPGFAEIKKKPWFIFVLIMVILIVIALIVYVILHKWYKYKYEAHLFRNRNNLFNLWNYINNEKRRGISEDEIIKTLKKARWNSEQITYAMRKFKGKRTGMVDLPFMNLFSKKKTQDFSQPPMGMPPMAGEFRRKW